MAAYNSPTGIPFNTIALDTLDVRNPSWTRRSSTLSEFGSEQLEFVKLSHLTGNATYGQKAEYVIQLLHSKYPDKVRGHPDSYGCRTVSTQLPYNVCQQVQARCDWTDLLHVVALHTADLRQ